MSWRCLHLPPLPSAAAKESQPRSRPPISPCPHGRTPNVLTCGRRSRRRPRRLSSSSTAAARNGDKTNWKPICWRGAWQRHVARPSTTAVAESTTAHYQDISRQTYSRGRRRASGTDPQRVGLDRRLGGGCALWLASTTTWRIRRRRPGGPAIHAADMAASPRRRPRSIGPSSKSRSALPPSTRRRLPWGLPADQLESWRAWHVREVSPPHPDATLILRVSVYYKTHPAAAGGCKSGQDALSELRTTSADNGR